MTKRNAHNFQLWATCPACKWCWAVYRSLPAPVRVVVHRMAHARCPNCPTRKKPLMAGEAEIAAAMRTRRHG